MGEDEFQTALRAAIESGARYRAVKTRMSVAGRLEHEGRHRIETSQVLLLQTMERLSERRRRA